MARRRGGLMALRAALGAVGAGLQGYAEMQEREKERARREMLDIASFAERGWMSPEQFEQTYNGGMGAGAPGAAPSNALQSALTSAAAAPPAPSAAGSAQVFGQPPARRRPAGEVTIGQQRLMLPMTQQEREREFVLQDRAAQQTLERQRFEEMVKDLRDSGIPDADARRMARLGARYQDVVVTPEAQARIDLDREEMKRRAGESDRDYALRRYQIMSNREIDLARLAQSQVAAQGKRSAQSPLPTLSTNLERLQGMSEQDVKRLSPTKVFSAATAPLMLAKGGALDFLGGAAANIIADEPSREYALLIRAATDATARASEVGVLTNQDIARFQAQTLPLPGDTPADIYRKHQTLTRWTQWLANNKQAIETGTGEIVGGAPDELLDLYPQAQSFIERARANGASEDDIRNTLIRNQGRRR